MAAMSDDPIREWILSEGKATEITRISSVGGGCINRANRYDTDAGSFFVKTNRYLMFRHFVCALPIQNQVASLSLCNILIKSFKFESGVLDHQCLREKLLG